MGWKELLYTAKKMRGDYSKNSATSLARGRKIVLYYLPLIAALLIGGTLLGVLQVEDSWRFIIYGSIPFIFDSGLIFESIPLVSRLAPRAIIALEFGTEVIIGLSLGAVYGIYKIVGVVSMGANYYKSLIERK